MTWDGLIEIFNPNYRHLREERDRKRIEARIPGSEDQHDRIDFLHNSITIKVPPHPQEAGPEQGESGDETDDETGDETGENEAPS